MPEKREYPFNFKRWHRMPLICSGLHDLQRASTASALDWIGLDWIGSSRVNIHLYIIIAYTDTTQTTPPVKKGF